MKNKELVAQEGYWLTLAKIEEGEIRNFWKRLYPAASLSEQDFVEWSDEEKSAWEREHPQEIPEGSVGEA